ncbi:MAG TPA: hypothetical protein VE135_01140 [Pyrinomonadaceae bacterium]|nr:hypothetical protein [Pyrinomonadaceae bacterium]
MKVQVRWDGRSAGALYEFLASNLHANEVKLELREMDAHGATIDPTVLVAIVSGTSAGVSALITGILQLIQGHRSSMVLQSANGRKLEIPVNTSKERIQEIIKLLEEMDIERITVIER